MKFSNPLKRALWVTQTYHTNSSNRAIDISAVADWPVYAMTDGVVKNVSSSYGSYMTIKTEGFNPLIYYVHVYRFQKKVGDTVKEGELICYVAPKSKNGGYPTHLHTGLGKTTKGFSNIMDYMDRGIEFRTGGPVIKKLWFNGDNINWSLFNDYDYRTDPKPEPEPDPVVDYEKKYTNEQTEHNNTKAELKECEATCAKRVITIKECEDRVAEIEKERVAFEEEIATHKEKIKELEESNRRLTDSITTYRGELVKCNSRHWFSVFLSQVFGYEKAE